MQPFSGTYTRWLNFVRTPERPVTAFDDSATEPESDDEPALKAGTTQTFPISIANDNALQIKQGSSLLDAAQDRGVRLAGSVYFKNVLKRRWSEVRACLHQSQS